MKINNKITYRGKPVMMFGEDDALIGIYPSIYVASKETGITTDAISNCVNGRCRKTKSRYHREISEWVTWEKVFK